MKSMINEDPRADLQSAVGAVEEQRPQTEIRAEASGNRTRKWFRALSRLLPTAAVMAVLAGLGYWGDHTDWKIPKYAELTGTADSISDDWCEEHGVPESMCVECNPDDYPKRKLHGWCKVHGVHECPLHHTDVAQLKVAPQIEQRDLDRASKSLDLRPRAENNFACTNPGRRIQFASQDSVAKAGVDVEPVLRAPIVESVSATGEIRYDETHVARLSTKANGIVWRVEKQVGDVVRAGEVLVVIDAVEVGRAKSELLAALAQESLDQRISQRQQRLAKQGITAKRQAQEAETEFSKARIRVLGAEQALINLGLPVSVENLRGLSEKELATTLRFLGLPKSLVSRLDPATTTSNLIPVPASFDGVVVSRQVVPGEVVDTSKVLFEVVDTSRMWLTLNVRLEDANYIEVGQKVEFLPDGATEEVTGAIDWKSTTADQQTRMVMVRANLENTEGRLLSETFGVGRLILREETDAIVIPNEALQWDGSCHVVFVRDKAWFEKKSPKLFHTRSVRPGAKTEKYTEIIAGVLPGEVIATIGSDVLRAQLLKNNLGAG